MKIIYSMNSFGLKTMIKKDGITVGKIPDDCVGLIITETMPREKAVKLIEEFQNGKSNQNINF